MDQLNPNQITLSLGIDKASAEQAKQFLQEVLSEQTKAQVSADAKTARQLLTQQRAQARLVTQIEEDKKREIQKTVQARLMGEAKINKIVESGAESRKRSAKGESSFITNLWHDMQREHAKMTASLEKDVDAQNKKYKELIGTIEKKIAAERQAAVPSSRPSAFQSALSQRTIGAPMLATAAGYVAGNAIQATAASMKDIVEESTKLETSLVMIRNNTEMTDAEFEQFRQTTIKLGEDTGASFDEIGKAYMRAKNYGFAAADAFKVVDAATKSAVGSGADLEKTGELLASVMHNFGLQGDKALVTMNLLHEAALLGDTTIEEFVAHARPMLSLAASFGLPLKEALALSRAISQAGFNAAEAATQMKGIMIRIANPANSAIREMVELQKRTGVDLRRDFTASGLAARGLVGVMDDVRRATMGDTDAVMKLIPAQRGGVGAFILTKTGADSVREAMEKLAEVESGKLDPTTEGLKRQQGTLQAAMDRFHNTLIGLANTSGPGFMQFLTHVVDESKTWLETLGKLSTAIGDVMKERTPPGWIVMLSNAVEGLKFIYHTDKDIGEGFSKLSDKSIKYRSDETTLRNEAFGKISDGGFGAGDMIAMAKRYGVDINTSMSSETLRGQLKRAADLAQSAADLEDNKDYAAQRQAKKQKDFAKLDPKFNPFTWAGDIVTGAINSASLGIVPPTPEEIKAAREAQKAAQREADEATKKEAADIKEIQSLKDEADKSRLETSSYGYSNILDIGTKGLAKGEHINPEDLHLANRNLYNNAIVSAGQEYNKSTAPEEGDTPEKVAAKATAAYAKFVNDAAVALHERNIRGKAIDDALNDAINKRTKATGEIASSLASGFNKLKEAEDKTQDKKEKALEKQIKIDTEIDEDNLKSYEEWKKKQDQDRKEREEAAKEYLDAEREQIAAALDDAKASGDFVKQKELILLQARNRMDAILSGFALREDTFTDHSQGQGIGSITSATMMTALFNAIHEQKKQLAVVAKEQTDAQSRDLKELGNTLVESAKEGAMQLYRGRHEKGNTRQVGEELEQSGIQAGGKYLAAKFTEELKKGGLKQVFDDISKNLNISIKGAGSSAGQSIAEGALALYDVSLLMNSKKRPGTLIGGLIGGIAGSFLPGGWALGAGIGGAIGGQFAGGGYPPGGRSVLVGEYGPELAEFPGGTRIHNAQDTAAMMGGQHYVYAPNVSIGEVHGMPDLAFVNDSLVSNYNSFLNRKN